MKKVFSIMLFFFYSITMFAQLREFSKWDATAFCSYTRYHPYSYLKADNNWEILQTLRTPQTRQYLDSLKIKNLDSQMMLLRIEGFISQEENGKWVTTMPLLDSLQTVAARTFSLQIANDLYPKIKSNCISLVDFLKQQKYQDNAYSILFSYVLDGEIWKSFNSYEELKSAATWDGECWAFYFPRNFNSGTNTYYNEFSICWTKKQPEFVWRELDHKTFIEPFLVEYKKNGKIISPDIFEKALSLGIIFEDGSLHIPVINSKDDNQLNIYSNRIIDVIVQYFSHSNIIPVFQQKFGINHNQQKLACTMLYHEVMWDLIDLLINDKVIQYPILWNDMKKESTYSIIYIKT